MTGAHANEVPRRGWGGQDGKPPWDLVLHVDWCFRKHAATHLEEESCGPSPFPPYARPVPPLGLDVQGWRFQAHAHDEASSWVGIEYESQAGNRGRYTVITETRGPLAGRRVVRATSADHDLPDPVDVARSKQE